MVEGTGKRAKTTDRHIVTLSPELSEQVDDALDIVRLRTILKPVEATLGNPVAFPVLFGLGALGVGVLILRFLFPRGDPLAPGFIGNVVGEVRDVAGEIAEIIHTPLPNIPGVVDLEEVRRNLVEGTTELLVRIWKGITRLPPIL